MKRRNWMLLSVALFSAMNCFAAERSARDCGSTGTCRLLCEENGGGNIPTPFSGVNQFVEMADGESYLLIGTIHVDSDQSGFEVDLCKQPWLASAYRRKMPIYPVSLSSGSWKQFDGKKVRVKMKAHAGVVGGNSVLWLTPVTEPSVLTFELSEDAGPVAN